MEVALGELAGFESRVAKADVEDEVVEHLRVAGGGAIHEHQAVADTGDAVLVEVGEMLRGRGFKRVGDG